VTLDIVTVDRPRVQVSDLPAQAATVGIETVLDLSAFFEDPGDEGTYSIEIEARDRNASAVGILALEVRAHQPPIARPIPDIPGVASGEVISVAQTTRSASATLATSNRDYRVSSDRSLLTADPADGTIAVGASDDVSVPAQCGEASGTRLEALRVTGNIDGEVKTPIPLVCRPSSYEYPDWTFCPSWRACRGARPFDQLLAACDASRARGARRFPREGAFEYRKIVRLLRDCNPGRRTSCRMAKADTSRHGSTRSFACLVGLHASRPVALCGCLA